MDPNRGVIYIAFGDLYIAEAIHSATSLKQHSQLPATIFTDRETKAGCFDREIIISPQHKRAKIDFLSQSPYERTLYLDSDTEVTHDISDVFDLLDRFDIAAAHDHSRKSSRWSQAVPAYAAIPYAFSEYNGGVVLYRKNDLTDQFFEDWRRIFTLNKDLTHGQDQCSFRIALWQSQLSIGTLPPEFNVRNEQIRKKMKERSRGTADSSLLKHRILHWHGLDKPKLLSAFRSKYKPMKF